MKTVNQPVRKKDAMQLVTGQPVYMDDVIPQDCLIVKLLRSPHANAIVKNIDTSRAMLVPGMEVIYTWKDVDQNARRYTQAGQTYPEMSPYDRLVIDRHVRFAGDVVAILAGKDETCVDKAMKLIQVEYEVLPAVLDFHTALDNPILVHPEDNWEALVPGIGADKNRNLCAHDESGEGDIEAVLAGCDVVIDHTYHTRACQQAMMETFRTYCSIDAYGRLNVLSSTQIVFHCRRILANALHIPKSMIRVAKPRIGGGFGAKQTSVCEVYPAFVTWKTKKPSKIIYTRFESQTASTPCGWAQQRTASSRALTCTPFPTPALTVSTAPQRWGFRATSPSRCTARPKRSALSATLFTPTTCHRVRTAGTAQPRVCLRWNPL